MAKLWHNILIALIRPWQYLPLGFHYAWGSLLYGLMRVFRYRKDVALINLSRSFPELKYKEIRKIAAKLYKNLGQIAAETMWLGGRCRRKENHARYQSRKGFFFYIKICRLTTYFLQNKI